MSEPALAVVGLIRNAQGIRGEVVVELLTDAPDAVFASGRRVFVGDKTGGVTFGSETALEVEEARPFKGGLIVKFDSLADRNAAELLRGRYLLAPFEELEPLREDEVYLHDLIGMSVALDTGEKVGEVKSYYELPQGLMLEVKTEKGTVLVPYRSEIIERIDREAKTVFVKSSVGLFE